MTDPTEELIASLNHLATEEADFYRGVRQTKLDRDKKIAMWKDHFGRTLPFRGQTPPQTAHMMYGLLELTLDWLVDMSSSRLPGWKPRDVFVALGVSIDEAIWRKQPKREPSLTPLVPIPLTPEEQKAECIKTIAAFDDEQAARYRQYIHKFDEEFGKTQKPLS